MEGRIKDDPTNVDAWFEVIDVEQVPGGRIYNDVIEPYSLYLLKKVGDNSHPRITIATSGIDKRSFNFLWTTNVIFFEYLLRSITNLENCIVSPKPCSCQIKIFLLNICEISVAKGILVYLFFSAFFFNHLVSYN